MRDTTREEMTMFDCLSTLEIEELKMMGDFKILSEDIMFTKRSHCNLERQYEFSRAY